MHLLSPVECASRGLCCWQVLEELILTFQCYPDDHVMFKCNKDYICFHVFSRMMQKATQLIHMTIFGGVGVHLRKTPLKSGAEPRFYFLTSSTLQEQFIFNEQTRHVLHEGQKSLCLNM